jgi:hypothetical protein
LWLFSHNFSFLPASLLRCHSQELFAETREAFFKKHKQRFVNKVVRAIANNDLANYVANSDVSRWRETMAILLTYTSDIRLRCVPSFLSSFSSPFPCLTFFFPSLLQSIG